MNAADKLRKAKIQLMIKSPFYSTVMLGLKHELNVGVPTAGTDSVTVYYNPFFLDEITLAQTIGLIAHEVGHVIRQHISRRGQRNPNRWNQAGDHIINLDLLEMNFELPPNGRWDKQFKDMTTEAVYNLIPEDLEFICDILPLPINKDPIEIKDRITGLVSAAMGAAKQAGEHIPGSLAREVGLILNPKIDYRILLQKYMTEMAKDDQSWIRPNKRFLPDLYLPSAHSYSIKNLTVAFDTSGSVTVEEGKQYLGQVHHMRQIFNIESLTLITVDTEIRDIIKIPESKRLDTIKIHGSGGTDFRSLFLHLNKNRPSILVFFTDMCVDFNFPKPRFPVIWINTFSNGKAPKDYGITININNSLT